MSLTAASLLRPRCHSIFFVTSAPFVLRRPLCSPYGNLYRNHPPQESPFTRPCKLFDIAIRRALKISMSVRSIASTLSLPTGIRLITLSSLIFRLYIYIYIPFSFPLLAFNLSFLHPSVCFVACHRDAIEPGRPFSFLFFFFFERLLLLARRADYTNVQLPPVQQMEMEISDKSDKLFVSRTARTVAIDYHYPRK